MKLDDIKLSIIGLGYVGLPLALEFGKLRKVIGFDTNKNRVNELKNFEDSGGEFSKDEIKSSVNLEFTNEIKSVEVCNTYIISVPTPINKNNQPDLKILLKATKMVAGIRRKKYCYF